MVSRKGKFRPFDRERRSAAADRQRQERCFDVCRCPGRAFHCAPGAVWPGLLVPPFDGLRVGGDRAVDLDAVAVFDRGFELGELAEDADSLAVEVDVGVLAEQPGVLDRFTHGAAVGDVELEPGALEFVRVGYADVH